MVGDPVSTYVDPRQLDLETLERVRNIYHLNDPIYIQYFYWLKSVLRGDLGVSTSTGAIPVNQIIARYFPLSLELGLFTIIFAIPITIFLGTFSTKYRNTIIDHGIRVFTVLFRGMPSFFFALMLAITFYPRGLITFNPRFNFPTITGMPLIDSLIAGNIKGIIEAIRYLWGPLVVQVFLQLALGTRILRASMLEEIGKDYALFAKSKGLSADYVLLKYVRKNGLSAFMTLIGLQIVWLLTGTVITETIFNRKGLGWFSAFAAQQLDYNGVLSYTLITGVFLIVANSIVDIAYAKVDPRVTL